MGSIESERVRAILPAAALLVVVLLLVGACTDDGQNRTRKDPPEQRTEMAEKTTPPATVLETTEDSQPPEVTLGGDSEGGPNVVIRLEGDPETTFSGLCSVGAAQKVLSGQVPQRFEFDPRGQRLSCRIEKRDNEKGDLKVVLAAGGTTRSVQQTNTPGGVIKVSYKG